jgi:hypothetical protein
MTLPRDMTRGNKKQNPNWNNVTAPASESMYENSLDTVSRAISIAIIEKKKAAMYDTISILLLLFFFDWSNVDGGWSVVVVSLLLLELEVDFLSISSEDEEYISPTFSLSVFSLFIPI